MVESKNAVDPNMKWIALFLLVVQNTALVLMMRYSLTKTSDHYIVTTAVACMEVRVPFREMGYLTFFLLFRSCYVLNTDKVDLSYDTYIGIHSTTVLS